MVKPDYFDVTYSINPYMTDEKGNLNQINKQKAILEWQELKKTYEKLGYTVDTLDGHPELPDMVFAANQSFPFLDPKTKSKCVLLSHMRSTYRKPEVAYFKKYYESQGYNVYELENKTLCLEGNGDALIQPGNGRVWGGFGPRTDKKVYDEFVSRFHLSVTPLELVTKDFYHLDTCFSILDEHTVAIQKEAFAPESLKLIEKGFKNILEVDRAENLKYFACNCHCPNGKDVILQSGTVQFKSNLIKNGFTVHEVETKEFIKAGGSVFCLKMMLF